MVEASAVGPAIGDRGTDRAFRVTVPGAWAEIVGAILMDLLGPFEQEVPGKSDLGETEPREDDSGGNDPCEGDAGKNDPGAPVALIFYPSPDVKLTPDDIVAALPPELRELDSRRFTVETRDVSRDWVEGWRDHFRPVVVEAVRIRPPWEPGPGEDLSESLVDVVINPGLGFGTGLHPTTRGVLQLLQGLEDNAGLQDNEGGSGEQGTQRNDGVPGEGGWPGGERVSGGEDAPPSGGSRRSALRPLVDVGTGSGILAIAAAKLGWRPILAFDNDAAALLSARENIETNGVQDLVRVRQIEVAEAPKGWFEGATVLANITLGPVSVLLRRLGAGTACSGGGGGAPGPDPGTVAAATSPERVRPTRVLVSGILAGTQEEQLVGTARESGFVPGARVYEAEWVSLEFLPTSWAGGRAPSAQSGEALADTAGKKRGG